MHIGSFDSCIPTQGLLRVCIGLGFLPYWPVRWGEKPTVEAERILQSPLNTERLNQNSGNLQQRSVRVARASSKESQLTVLVLEIGVPELQEKTRLLHAISCNQEAMARVYESMWRTKSLGREGCCVPAGDTPLLLALQNSETDARRVTIFFFVGVGAGQNGQVKDRGERAGFEHFVISASIVGKKQQETLEPRRKGWLVHAF